MCSLSLLSDRRLWNSSDSHKMSNRKYFLSCLTGTVTLLPFFIVQLEENWILWTPFRILYWFTWWYHIDWRRWIKAKLRSQICQLSRRVKDKNRWFWEEWHERRWWEEIQRTWSFTLWGERSYLTLSQWWLAWLVNHGPARRNSD